ncbi:DNA translocase FtsK [Parvularcula sp. IMCC14364]|uniref:DNA translocase FtsK n=1 Tax=Parvularcula sp. IMCC14364 TaxID=3067902 RepID=UPI002741B9D2|nr:DNA translocase FtsK [Parvularcula sp. IMCC14364]
MSRTASAHRGSYETPALVMAGQAVRALIMRAGGASLILLAIMLLVSVISYSVSDPSLNNATVRDVRNLFGSVGANTADFMLQLMGGAALLLPVTLAVWGTNAFFHGAPETTPARAWWRFFAWGLGVLCMAGFAGGLPLTIDWPFRVGMGGLLGDGASALLAAPLRMIGIPGAIIIASGLYLALSAFLTCFACGVRRDHIEAGMEAAMIIGDEIRYRAEQLAAWHMARFEEMRGERDVEDDIEEELEADEEEEIGSHLSLVEESAADEEELEEEHLSPAAQRRIIRKEKKKKSSKRERAELQPEFPAFSAEDYRLPPLNLLAKPDPGNLLEVSDEALEQNARMLETVLADFGVRGEIINVRPGPVVTLYELEPAAGVKSSRVINLSDDIARSMSAVACRVAVVPGRNAIGIELPNQDREMVYFREMMSSPEFEKSGGALTLSLGKNIGGEAVFADLAKMPHLLIAGTTGSGKSVGINTMILSLLYRLPPDQCKLIMVDPKMLELSVYEGIPHLLAPVVTDPRKAVVALKWTVREMEERYRQMSKLGVRNISGFNDRVREADERGDVLTRKVHTGYNQETGDPVYEIEELDYKPMPFIVVVIDEVADLMMVAGKDIEGMVQRLAQMARAAGIHMIMATQRPSVDVITGTIKANFPTRISFQVTSKIDSRTILGEQGAEQLLGQGDMLFMAGGGRLTRVHGAFVADKEVEKIVAHLKKQGKPDYVQEVTEMSDEDGGASDALGLSVGGNTSSGDALYDQAVAVVARDRKASTSYIQRRLQIGYNRAATLIEKMEDEGVISSANHAGKRDVLIGEDAA